MPIQRPEGEAALAAMLNKLAATYGLLVERQDPNLDAALDALFDALQNIDLLAGGILAPAVRETLDMPS